MGKEPGAQLTLIKAFLGRFPNDIHANYLMADTMMAVGHELNAIPFAQRAVQLGRFEPDHVALLLNLYCKFHFLEQVDRLLPQVLASGKSSAEQDRAIGNYYSRIAKAELALPYLKRACDTFVDVRSRHRTLGLLLECLRDANHNDEARALIEKQASSADTRSWALGELAQIARPDETVSLIEQIETQLLVPDDKDDPRTASSREALYLQLGNLKARQGRHDEAFEDWKASRALVNLTYSAAANEYTVKETKSFYQKSLFERTLPYANADASLVFVVGMPRSGTTLAAQILAAHPQAASAGELVRLSVEAKFFTGRYHVAGGLKQLLADAQAGAIASRTEDFLKLARLVAGKPAARLVDKTPLQFQSAGYIHMCFPHARFINMERHPADIFISTYQNGFSQEFGFAFDQEAFAHFFLKRHEILKYWRSLFPEKILDVGYESLTASPDLQVRRILDFLALDWDPACLKFFEHSSTVRTFSRDQVRSAINTKSVGRWRNYEKHLGPLFEALDKAGYSYPENSAANGAN
ncbi:sulfotransferase family protein [Aestuariivirga litoralis]|uniref:sulfotransferase family protein n=1 Tax=Aestuariivirga litoralis TaxID=2650924 RepID=UPI0018C726DD|nr:sulfotransferase [Aestuariivirga litoralis]